VTTLLESKARPYGSRKGAALSVAAHGALIAAAVVASGRAVLPEREKVEQHSVLFVTPPPPPKVHVAPEPPPEVKKPPATKAPAAPRRVAPPPPRPTQPQRAAPTAPAVIAPIRVPTSLPPVNLKAVPTVDVDIRIAPPPELPKPAAGQRGGLARSSIDGDVEARSGGRGGLGSGGSGRAYSESQVDRAVQVTRPAVPRYPDALRSVNIQGEVIAQYVVDARGRVEPGSIKVLSATHRLFAEAVRVALLNARYRPAEVGGQPVRQLVEQPFIFKLEP
jgi:TonB family protein